jgi:mannose-1-phosphate guanylyltransferase
VPLDAGWRDVGSWSSLWETAKEKDANNNVDIGDAILDGAKIATLMLSNDLLLWWVWMMSSR